MNKLTLTAVKVIEASRRRLEVDKAIYVVIVVVSGKVFFVW